MSNVNKIELAEMLKELRSQLLRTWDEGADELLKFEIFELEVDLQINTSKVADGKAGVQFWVYNAEAGLASSENNIQRLKLKLRPTIGTDTKEPVSIGDISTISE